MGIFYPLLFVIVLATCTRLIDASDSSQGEQSIDHSSIYTLSILLFNIYTFIDILVVPLHAETQFYCQTPDNTYLYAWRVNRTVVTTNSSFPDVIWITSQTLSNGSTQSSLTFRASDQANNTDIECFVTNGVHILLQLNYTMTVQGSYTI